MNYDSVIIDDPIRNIFNDLAIVIDDPIRNLFSSLAIVIDTVGRHASNIFNSMPFMIEEMLELGILPESINTDYSELGYSKVMEDEVNEL